LIPTAKDWSFVSCLKSEAKLLKLDPRKNRDPHDLSLVRATTDLKTGHVRNGPEFEYAVLEGADLEGTDLFHADLQHADLEGTDLFGANLQADLKGANLRGATLYAADLGSPRLTTGRDPRTADLRGADLRGALCDHKNSTKLAPSGGPIDETQLPRPFKCRAGGNGLGYVIGFIP
jgi:hypothetical protein